MKRIAWGIPPSRSAVGACGHRELSSVHKYPVDLLNCLLTMQLRFYANMRTAIGVSALEIEEVDSFRKLLNLLVERYPVIAFDLLDENHELRKDVPVYVDGRNPRLLEDGIDSPLPRDAVISFFSPVASGRMNVEVLREPAFRKGKSQ